MQRTKGAFKPATRSAHITHIRTYLSFITFMGLPVEPSIHSLLAFLEYLYTNSISHKVILNYISSLKKTAQRYAWQTEVFLHRLISEYLRSISINSRFAPTCRDIFDISTLALISQTCDVLDDPILFRAIFLLAFFAFLRMSNSALHSRYKFDGNKHILRRYVIFAQPGAYILLKWTKTLQESSAHHFIQIPSLSNTLLCPVLAIRKLMASRILTHSSPLFAHNLPPYLPVIDTTIRDVLRKVLAHIGIPSLGHGFHLTFLFIQYILIYMFLFFLSSVEYFPVMKNETLSW